MPHSPTLLDVRSVPWSAVGVSALQTFVVYWFAMAGLKLVGRRSFGELGPQDVVLLLLLSEALSAALMVPEAGFWGAIASAATLLATVAVTERIKALRQALDGEAVTIVRDGEALEDVMARYQVDDGDLAKAAREYGVAGPEAFERAVLEGDGSITAVLKPEFRGGARKVETKPF